MAMPSPDELLYRGINEAARDSSRILPEGWDLIQGSMRYAGEAAAAGEGAEAVDVAVAAASSLFDGTAILLLGLLAVILYLCYYLHVVIRNVAGRIPLGIGSKLQAVVDMWFAWETPVGGWVAENMNHAAVGMMHGFAMAVQWALQRTRGIYPAVIDSTIENYTRPIVSDLAHLHVDFNHLWSWVNQLSHVVGHDAVSVANPGGAVVDQVHELQRQVAHVMDLQVQTSGQLAVLNGTLAAIEADFSLLSAHVVGVRAVNVGFQDLVTEVQTLQTEVHSLQTHTIATVDTHTGQINTLFPLGILLDAGAVGLRNLRKLEDNPCQCPRLPGVQNEIALAMSVLHHLKGD